MSDFNSIFFQAERPLLKEITSNRLNTILQEIRRNKPRGERGITVRHSGDGTYIGLAAGLGGRSSSPQVLHPFKVVPSVWSDPDSEPPADQWQKIKVLPGLINNVLASNWNEEFTAAEGARVKLRVTLGGEAGYVLSTALEIGGAIDPEAEETNQINGYELDGNGVPISATVDLAILSVDSEAETVGADQMVSTSLQVVTVQNFSDCNSRQRTLVWSRV